MESDGNCTMRPLGVVWIDLTGLHVTSWTGNKYTVDLIDDHTSYGWMFPVPKKSDGFDKVQAWEKMVKAETGLEVGTYWTDNGELKSNKISVWKLG